jgi:hypothetical protein
MDYDSKSRLTIQNITRVVKYTEQSIVIYVRFDLLMMLIMDSTLPPTNISNKHTYLNLILL